MFNSVIWKKGIALFLAMLMLQGCGTDTTAEEVADQENAVVKESDAPMTEEPALREAEDDPNAFYYGDALIKVDEKKTQVNAIIRTELIGNAYIFVEGHINPYRSYFGIYDIANKTFVDEKYGFDCIWYGDDISTLLYITGPKWADDGSNYCVYNFEDELILESEQEIGDFQYKDENTITYFEYSEDENGNREGKQKELGINGIEK